jgi:pimeloyl-ACP methyl ester carboxylesterase
MSGSVAEGTFYGGVPYLRLGTGPPLIAARLVTADHKNPTGLERRMVLSGVGAFAEHFTVYVVNGPPGLPADATMSDIATRYAQAIEHDIGESVCVHGVSTGAAVALQLAIDHPHLVRRLVLAGAACRLSPRGREVNAKAARLTAGGDYRRAMAVMTWPMVPGLLRPPVSALAWALAPLAAPDDPADMLAVAAAESAFDAEADLGKVTAPTLVIGGSADPFSAADAMRRTAEGVAEGTLALFAGKSHSYAISSKAAIHVALGFLLADHSLGRAVSAEAA